MKINYQNFIKINRNKIKAKAIEQKLILSPLITIMKSNIDIFVEILNILWWFSEKSISLHYRNQIYEKIDFKHLIKPINYNSFWIISPSSFKTPASIRLWILFL